MNEDEIKKLIDRYTEKTPVFVEDEPDAHNVYFRVNQQHFCITPIPAEDADHAEWFRRQLAVALSRLIEQQLDRYRWVPVEERLPEKPSWNVGLRADWWSAKPPFFIFQYYGQELEGIAFYFSIPPDPGVENFPLPPGPDSGDSKR